MKRKELGLLGGLGYAPFLGCVIGALTGVVMGNAGMML